jgi:hypothetical protein
METRNDREYLAGEVEVGEFPTIPANTYDATLDGITEELHDLYGIRWVWHWIIPEMHPDGGDFELQVWTPPRISSTGIAREMAQALGADTSNRAKVDRGALRGKSARLAVVLDDDAGRNRVKAVMSAEATAAPAAAADPEYAQWKAEQATKAAANAEEPPHPSETPAAQVEAA